MRPLQAPWLWLALGWLLVAGACLGSLLPGNKVPMPGQYDKLLHGGTYLLLTVWFAGIYRAGRYPLIAGLLVLLGVGLEFAQRLVVSRTFDGFDLTANVVGIAVGLGLAMWFLGGWCQRIEVWLFGRSARSP